MHLFLIDIIKIKVIMLNKIDSRSKNLIVNMFHSSWLRVISIIIGLVLVPIELKYLGAAKYGVWITLSSMINWFSFFNLGLGNGLQNQVAAAIAMKDYDKTQLFVSTAYALISIIVIPVMLILLSVNFFLDWNKILNVSSNIISNTEIKISSMVIIISLCFQLILRILNNILLANQKSFLVSVNDVICKLAILILIYIVFRFYKHQSMIVLSSITGLSSVIILFLLSVYYFNFQFKTIKPRLSQIKLGNSKILFNLGAKFFILQIAVMVIYNTNNIIITNLFGPESVTNYNITFKYYSLITMGFSIILTPTWSAFTDAWVIQDYAWIAKIVKNLKRFWCMASLAGVLMVFLSSMIYKLWVGDSVQISFAMNALVCFWVLANAFNGIYSNLFNGIGKIKLQMIIAIFSSVLNIPLTYGLGKILGINGLLIGNIIIALVTTVIYPIQYNKIMGKEDFGIWGA